jgi:hypothetical protein
MRLVSMNLSGFRGFARPQEFDLDDKRLISMYSETGLARVELRMRDHVTGALFTVTRSFDRSSEPRVALKTPDNSFQDQPPKDD